MRRGAVVIGKTYELHSGQRVQILDVWCDGDRPVFHSDQPRPPRQRCPGRQLGFVAKLIANRHAAALHLTLASRQIRREYIPPTHAERAATAAAQREYIARLTHRKG